VNRGVADTSVCDAREAGRPLVEQDLRAQSAISVITVGELQVGVLAAANIETRDWRLATLTRALALDPLPIDRSVAESSARLRVMRRDSGLRMSVNESWIAASAVSDGWPLVTQDDAYVEVASLEIIRV
jgi:predicted nucleic acid-binding protein